ncbi:MAG: 3-deoxy-8-phosphooctulonate synthase [Planctomycetota bacterium]|jgi:2-dehydro-3-deoxyphosphooctonate aldolase (KDO 8-P synthase)
MSPLREDGRLLLIAGPCVIEGRDMLMRAAERLKAITDEREITFVFKSSFDKANRTSVESFRGPGLEDGLALLAEVKEQVGVPVNTDFHTPDQAAPVAGVCDLIQVPAFLARQTDMLVAAGRTGRPVMVKKGQFMSPESMEHSLDKVRSVDGAGEVMLCERGSTFGYGNLVVDFRSLPIMRGFAPVVFDGTHSVQRPSGLGTVSGGDRTMIPYLVKAAAAVGIDGLFLESHADPDKAKCDGPNQLPLDELPALLDAVLRIRDAAG